MPVLQAQRAEMDALLLRQAATEEERQRQRRERQAELERIQLAFAAQHMAACGWSALQLSGA